MSNTIANQSITQTHTKSRSSNVTENGTPIVMPGEEASKDLFLKLLVAQMKNQDPFNPQDPTQYVTQLSQFTTMEQIMDLNDNMEYLTALTDGLLINSAMNGASALIGKTVEVYKPEADKEDTDDNKTEDTDNKPEGATEGNESAGSSTDGETSVDGTDGSSSEESKNPETLKGVVESVEIKDGVVYMNIKDESTGEVVSVEYASLIKVS